MSKRILDRIAALEALLAPPQVREPLAAPVPDLSHEQWQDIAVRQQAFLIATGQEHMQGVAARAAERTAAERAAERAAETPPPPKPTRKPPPVFPPSIFAARH